MISGKLIDLRSVTMEDSEQIIRWRNSELVKSHFILQSDLTMDSQRVWMEQVIANGKAVQFLILEKSGTGVGTVYLRDIDRTHRKAEYGIFIGESQALGKGYGTEAARLMTEFGFSELHLHKIYLQVFAENERARRSYRKAGFSEEAVLRDEVFARGAFHDMVRMAVFEENRN